MFLKNAQPEPQAAKCACCPEPSAGDCWGTPLCDAHWLEWTAESPTAGEIEAKATPEHVLSRTECQFFAPVVVLKPGVMERYYRAWTAQWVKRKSSLIQKPGNHPVLRPSTRIQVASRPQSGLIDQFGDHPGVA